MLIVRDEPKRLANLDKRGIDFAEFEDGFDFANAIEVPTYPSRTGRTRMTLIGELNGELVVVAVVSPLGSEALSLASVVPHRGKGIAMASDNHAPDYVPNPHYTKEDWDEVSDNPELTEEQLARARPLAEVRPQLVETMRRKRGSQKAPTKELVALRLDRDVLAKFRSEGPGWQSRMNEALRRAGGL